jgi:uncharacterized protein (DUF302 family)
MKLLSKIAAGLLLSASLNAADINVYEATDSKAINQQTVGAMFKSLNYSVEAVSNLDKKFKKVFEDTTFDKFKIIAVKHNALSEKLIEKYPDAGAFIPFSVALQSYSNSDKVTFTTLDTDTMKKVLNAPNCKLLDKLETRTNKVAKAFGFDTAQAKTFDYNVTKPLGDLLYKKEMVGDGAALAKKLTDTMKKHKFTIVNELDLTKEYETVNKKYEYYTTYSICKVKVLYLAAKTRPEAAAFAPCSLAVYKEKGSDKVTFAFPSTYNWLSSLDMKDPKAVEILKAEQKEIEHFIESLNAK